MGAISVGLVGCGRIGRNLVRILGTSSAGQSAGIELRAIVDRTDPETLEQEVKSTGFYRNKARSIRALGAALVERHGGKVPDDLEALIELPGIGRKTANLLRADAFGKPGLIIDTHQIRLNERLGFTRQDDATRIELELRAWLPERDWTDWSHALTLHGRYTCLARQPRCGECPLTDLCPFFARKP